MNNEIALLEEIDQLRLDNQMSAMMMRHDLLGILRSLEMHVNIVRESYCSSDDDVSVSIERMSALVAGMKVAVQVASQHAEAGQQLILADINLKSVLDRVQVNLQASIDEVGPDTVVCECDESLTVIGDKKALVSIVQNLVENALKFRSDERKPQIRITASPVGQGKAAIEVWDNGIGIEEQFLEKIFAMFARLRPDDYEGSGAGLAIVKRLVEAHHSKLNVESKHGEWTRFWFLIRQSFKETMNGHQDRRSVN